MDPLNPGARPRRGVIAVASFAAASALVGVLVVALPPSTAAASGLESFASCGEVAAWGRASQERSAEQAMAPVGVETMASEADSGSSSTGGAAAPTELAGGAVDRQTAVPGADGGTNVVVEGVDELDLVDRLGDDRALVVADDRLAIVDLARAELVATLDVPAGAQVTYDPEARVAWVVGSVGSVDGGVLREEPTDSTGRSPNEVDVARVAVGDDSLATEADWTTSGALVDARRVGDRLHLVATDGFAVPTEGDVAVPFEDGPVPCDQVLHPVGPSDPSATLLVTLPVTGELEPAAAAEVVGAGQLVHVTTDAAYLATPLWEGGGSVTALHRFDLDTLAHTGSGRVEGALLDEFSMSDHEGVLRVAVTHDGGVVGRPIPVDGIGAGEVFTEEPQPSPPPPGFVAPDAQPVEPDSVGPDEPEPDGPESQILNEVVVLDTEGDLDVVGRTERFGHPGERIQGVRFVGDVAYAVTFLQTDPFYVLDLSSPTAPAVTGEVELPGFSAYLHPISETLVAGFGPGADGAAAVKLFDVSDPAAPKVVDDLALGDESAVVWDHHAFVDLGEGRFAVPATTYTDEFPESCPPAAQQEAKATEARIQGELQDIYAQQETGDPDAAEEQAAALYEEMDVLTAEGCLYPGTVPDSAVVVVDASDGRLREVERLDVRVAGGATRVLPSDAGWAVLGNGELVLLDPAGAERNRLELH